MTSGPAEGGSPVPGLGQGLAFPAPAPSRAAPVKSSSHLQHRAWVWGAAARGVRTNPDASCSSSKAGSRAAVWRRGAPSSRVWGVRTHSLLGTGFPSSREKCLPGASPIGEKVLEVHPLPCQPRCSEQSAPGVGGSGRGMALADCWADTVCCQGQPRARPRTAAGAEQPVRATSWLPTWASPAPP